MRIYSGRRPHVLRSYSGTNGIRDSQRQKVYDWEGTHVPGSSVLIPLADCEALIARVCADYNLHSPPVRDGRGTRAARGGSEFINLPRWSRSVPIVLHETAHAILIGKYGSYRYAPHGPEFMRLYLDLLAKYAKLPARELRASATAVGLKIAVSSAVPKPLDREEKRLRAEVLAATDALSTARKALASYLASKK